MLSEKEIKKIFREKTSKDPDAFYPVITLKKRGFTRYKCTACGRHFWKTKHSDVCGDAPCAGGFSFIGNSPATKKLDYIQALEEYLRIHEKLGYTPIKRYPVVARWNPTVDFTIAGIACFQPFVVSGEVEPPANPLAMPQFCLRFTDTDNVGITGHYVGFIMLGEQTFVPPEQYDVNKYMNDHLTWLNEGMGVSDEHLTIHEDFWAGGGNFGPSMEFFSGGLELSNQVYMQYEITQDGYQELKIKVLDMGQGHERIPWFTQGLPSIYEAVYPPVIEKLRKITGLEFDEKFMTTFAPHSALLNIGEVEDIEAAWEDVAKRMGMSRAELQGKILPNAALYSIAEHARALLFAISDGALPSNVGGYYNLRVILRRALSFIDKFAWKVDICDVCEWHADYLEPLFPELKANLVNVRKILEVEKLKYEATREKTKELILQYAKKDITTEELIELYDSQGINPEELVAAAKTEGKTIEIPPNFYALVSQRHEQKAVMKTEREEVIDLGELPETKGLYFDDWKKVEFEAKVLKVIDNYIVLDQTAFYPVSGGQAHDKGILKGYGATCSVIDVFKQGHVIVHKVNRVEFKEGDTVTGKLDLSRRKQLTQHHTATHIINAAAKFVLGDHINQAGARKDMDKAYIDVTHYQGLSEQEVQEIEEKANDIVKKNIPVEKSFMSRTDAEKKFGVRIYQGGVAPGKRLRIVDIKNIDVEACGGTHLNNTSEAEQIKLVNTTKIKDGVLRITFCAGNAAKQSKEQDQALIDKLAVLLNVTPKQIPKRAEELFTKWKKARKAVNKKKQMPLSELELSSKEEFEGNIIELTSKILKTQPEHLLKVLERFKKELDEFKKQLVSI